MAEQQTEDSFLKQIDNPDILWTFQLVGYTSVTARVINCVMIKGTPIILMVQMSVGKTIEIPWTSIQYITREKRT